MVVIKIRSCHRPIILMTCVKFNHLWSSPSSLYYKNPDWAVLHSRQPKQAVSLRMTLTSKLTK